MSIWLGPVSGKAFRAIYATGMSVSTLSRFTVPRKLLNQLTFNAAFAAGDKNAPRIVEITCLISAIPAIRLPIAFVIGAFPTAATAFKYWPAKKFMILSSHLQTPLTHDVECVALLLGLLGHLQSDSFLHSLRLGSIILCLER